MVTLFQKQIIKLPSNITTALLNKKKNVFELLLKGMDNNFYSLNKCTHYIVPQLVIIGFYKIHTHKLRF